MRVSTRTRPTFLPRKVGKSIRSDAQPFGFPRVLGQTGEAVNSLRSNIRPLVSCLPCAVRLCVSRSCRTNQILLQEPTPVGDCSPRGLGFCEWPPLYIDSLLTRRASQSLTGGKRGVFERSELASACQGQEAQSSRQAALAGCLFLCLLSFGQAKERRVLRRTRRFEIEVRADARIKLIIAKRFRLKNHGEKIRSAALPGYTPAPAKPSAGDASHRSVSAGHVHVSRQDHGQPPRGSRLHNHAGQNGARLRCAACR